jgi:hypothetical protein
MRHKKRLAHILSHRNKIHSQERNRNNPMEIKPIAEGKKKLMCVASRYASITRGQMHLADLMIALASYIHLRRAAHSRGTSRERQKIITQSLPARN